jgi:hypothetical protein
MQLTRLPSHKALWKAFILLLVLGYVGVAVRDSAALSLGWSDQPREIKRAVALDPSSALYRDRLGEYFMFSEQRPDLAIRQYESAVTLNPYIADYWLDLASAYSATGAADQQKLALERALSVDPKTPAVSQQVANALLFRGDLRDALKIYRTVMETDPWDVDSTLQICWQATHDVDMMSEALPPVPSVYLAFLNLLIGQQKTTEAEQVWPRLIGLGQAFDPSLAKPYVEYLIAQHHVGHAREAWENLGRMDPGFRRYLSSAQNLVVNGGFEEKIVNMGFDWRYMVEPHVVLAVDTEQFHGGSHSLSITFDGEAVIDTGLTQFIPVNANTRYSFSAYAMADDISAVQGPQFVISDVDDTKSLLTTEELLGTTTWKQVSGSFETGPNTDLVSVKITRPAGAGRITGKLRIDDVAMVTQ